MSKYVDEAAWMRAVEDWMQAMDVWADSVDMDLGALPRRPRAPRRVDYPKVSGNAEPPRGDDLC